MRCLLPTARAEAGDQQVDLTPRRLPIGSGCLLQRSTRLPLVSAAVTDVMHPGCSLQGARGAFRVLRHGSQLWVTCCTRMACGAASWASCAKCCHVCCVGSLPKRGSVSTQLSDSRWCAAA